MLILSLKFLLLSNSTISRRDKSILYLRATITILIIGILITQNNLNFIFINKGIGIFGGLFSATCTTTVFQVFILFITSVILLLSNLLRVFIVFITFVILILTTFYPLMVNRSLDGLLFTGLMYYLTTIPSIFNSQISTGSYKISLLKRLETWFLSSAIENFLASSKVKNILIIYLICALFLGLLGTAFSLLVWLELPGPGLSIENTQFYKNITTGYAIIMLFFIIIGIIFVAFYLSIKDKKKNSRTNVLFTIILTLGIILYLELNLFYSMLIISVIISIIFIIPLIFDNFGYNSYNVYLSYLGPILYMLIYSLTDNESIYSFITNTGLTYGHVLLIYTGIAMLILNTFIVEKDTMSPLNRLRNLYIVFKQNPNPLFWIGLVIVYIVLLQVLCNTLGLFIIRDSYNLFYITIMCRIIFIKVAISSILLLLTNNIKFWYSTISMNSLTPISILFTASLYYLYILPNIYKMYITLSNLKYAVGWYIGEVTDKFKDLDTKPLKVMCLKVVGLLLYPLGKSSKYNPSKYLNYLADQLLTENISKESESAKQLVSKRFLPVSYKCIKIIYPEYAYLINNVKHYNFTKTIPRVTLKNNLPVISINKSSSNVLFVKSYLDNFITMLNYHKLYAYINIFISNNSNINLNFEDFTVNLKLSENNNRLIDINIIKPNGKDYKPKNYLFQTRRIINQRTEFSSYIPKDYAFYIPKDYASDITRDYASDITREIDQITKSSYIQKLNNLVENTIKDTKVFASHGFNYDNHMLNSNPPSYPQMYYKISPNYPSINISTDRNYTYINFDHRLLQDGVNKWAYLKEILKITSETLKSNSCDVDLATLNSENVIINDPNDKDNASLLMRLVNEALISLNIQSRIGDFPIFTEEFLNKLDRLDYSVRYPNQSGQSLPQTVQSPFYQGNPNQSGQSLPQTVQSPFYQGNPNQSGQSILQTAQSPLYQGNPQMVQAPIYQGNPQMAQAPIYQGNPQMAQAPIYQGNPQMAQAPIYQGNLQMAQAPIYQGNLQMAQAPIYQGNPNLIGQPLPQRAQPSFFKPFPQTEQSSFYQRYSNLIGQSLPRTVQALDLNESLASSGYTAGPSGTRPTQNSVDPSSTLIYGIDSNDLNSLLFVLQSKFDQEFATRINAKDKSVNFSDIGLTLSNYGYMRQNRKKMDDYILNLLPKLFKDHRHLFLTPARTPVSNFSYTDVGLLMEKLRNPS